MTAGSGRPPKKRNREISGNVLNEPMTGAADPPRQLCQVDVIRGIAVIVRAWERWCRVLVDWDKPRDQSDQRWLWQLAFKV